VEAPTLNLEVDDTLESEELPERKPVTFAFDEEGAIDKMPDMPDMPDNIKRVCKPCIVCSGLAVVIAVAVIAIICSSIHTIEEGNVGIYLKFGAVMDGISYPGVNFMSPITTSVKQVSIRPQTDTLQSVGTVTRDGIHTTFVDVQVISRVEVNKTIELFKRFGPDFKQALVFDRIKEELRIFCANYTVDDVYNQKFLEIVEQVRMNVISNINRLGDGDGGWVEVMNLVIPKPDIPPDIANNYKQVKVQWTEKLVAIQQQATEEIKKKTEELKAIADAKRNKAVLEIKVKERILEKEGEKNVSEINNHILKAKEENLANLEKYKLEKEAEGNKQLYTPEYVQLNVARHLHNNTKFYFSGEQGLIGGLITKIFGN